MKRTWTVLLVAGTVAALLVLAPTAKKGIPSLPVVQAQEGNSGCSLASLNGRYAVEGQGTVVAQLPGFPPPPAPQGEVDIVTLNGAGSFSGSATLNIGGLVLKSVAFTGNYTVNSDCTGTATVNTSLGLTLHNAMVVIGGGQRFIETETDPFQVIQRRGQRLGD
jgi:hypothetical protein